MPSVALTYWWNPISYLSHSLAEFLYNFISQLESDFNIANPGGGVDEDSLTPAWNGVSSILSLLISFCGFVCVALRLCRESSSSSDVYKLSRIGHNLWGRNWVAYVCGSPIVGMWNCELNVVVVPGVIEALAFPLRPSMVTLKRWWCRIPRCRESTLLLRSKLRCREFGREIWASGECGFRLHASDIALCWCVEDNAGNSYGLQCGACSKVDVGCEGSTFLGFAGL